MSHWTPLLRLDLTKDDLIFILPEDKLKNRNGTFIQTLCATVFFASCIEDTAFRALCNECVLFVKDSVCRLAVGACQQEQASVVLLYQACLKMGCFSSSREAGRSEGCSSRQRRVTSRRPGDRWGGMPGAVVALAIWGRRQWQRSFYSYSTIYHILGWPMCYTTIRQYNIMNKKTLQYNFLIDYMPNKKLSECITICGWTTGETKLVNKSER